ncbi:MAG: tetratricopeptide repeat protein [Candidatus Lokiarchaeota archaeon]|nr:tetratricopeptide repeat protein [Candidatus Lokiarchaeota archaeon]
MMYNLSMFKRFEGKIEELFYPNDKYTFLIGAGISMEPPTQYPSAIEMVQTFLELLTPKEVMQDISMDDLRFEIVVEIVQRFIDEKLEFMNYFEILRNPNLIHAFLAIMNHNGHYIITTNYDYMIEKVYGMIYSNAQIRTVITKSEFLKYEKPDYEVKKGTNLLYKLHGCKQNYSNLKDTSDSLTITMKDFGKNSKTKNPLDMDSFMKPAIVNCMNERTLIVMGYSGGDDFDITPLIIEMHNFSRIFWIEHTNSEKLEILKYSCISANDKIVDLSLKREMRILKEIGNMGKIPVFLIKANTKEFVKNVLIKHLIQDKTAIKILKDEYIKEHIRRGNWETTFNNFLISMYENRYNPPILKKLWFAGALYKRIHQFEKAEIYYKKALDLAEKDSNIVFKVIFLYELGSNYSQNWNFDEAIDKLKEALILIDSLTIKGKKIINSIIGRIFISIGEAYKQKNTLSKALEYFKKSLKIAEKTGDLTAKASSLLYRGDIYMKTENYTDALNALKVSLGIIEELNNIEAKAACCKIIGTIFQKLGKKTKAIKYLELSYDIFKKLLLKDEANLLRKEIQIILEKTINSPAEE